MERVGGLCIALFPIVMKNLFSKKLEWGKGGRPFGWGSSPDEDWKTIFLFTILLIVAVGAWSFLTYFQIKSGALLEDEFYLGSELPSLNLEDLGNTTSYYQNKALELEKIKSGRGTNIVDPSI